jgi:hypothetical protein
MGQFILQQQIVACGPQPRKQLWGEIVKDVAGVQFPA